jgi:phenylpropionate dioxygenase-like ring-hydroxylating dioxygenase large terminal subunit
MRSLLDASYYTSPEIYEREQERIFRRLWIFAGPRTLLGEPDCFITRTIGGVPIVVQNFAGELRAFVNRCAHRQSALQIGDHGRRRLACPYHGWVYGSDGRATSIPFCDSLYGFDAETRASRTLSGVALECIGNMMFVNLDADPLPIDAQFHREFLDQLAHVSSFFDDEVLIAKFGANYNWKLNFENVLDFNHVSFIHPRGLASYLPTLVPEPGAKIERSAPPVPNDSLGTDLRDLSFETGLSMTIRPWPWHDQVARFSTDERYYNWFLYPNVNFFSMGAVIFQMQQYVPVAADRIEYVLWVQMARQEHRSPATPAILWSQARTEKIVVNEDAVVLEALQRGLTSGASPAFQGAYETRLRTMARVYLDRLA